jgi:peptide/nickel transport system substrate-binding protein
VGCGDDDASCSTTTTTAASTTTSSGTSAATASASAATSAATPTAQPKKGGTFRIVGAPPVTLNILTSSNGGAREFGGGFYPTLIQPTGVRWKDFPSGKYQANLAAVPEQPDPLTFTFKLNPKAKWGAPLGRAVTSDDVSYSLDRFLGRNGTAAPQMSDLAAVDKYETPDAQTITIHLSKPAASFLIKIASDYTFGVMPKETGTAFDPNNAVVTAGPWMLDKFDKAAGSWRLVRNPDWALGPDRPYLDAIESSNVPAYANQLVQFKGGNIDWISSVSPGDLSGILSARAGSQLRPQKGLGFTYFAFGEPRDSTAPWADQRVRQAISLSLDRATMMPIVYDTDLFANLPPKIDAGTDGPLDVPSLLSWHNVLPAGFPNQSIDPKTDPNGTGKYVKFDLAAAKQLLSAAGFADGFDAELHYYAWSDATTREVELAIQQLAKANIRIKPVLEDSATYNTTTYTGQFKGLGHFLQGYTEHADFLTALYNTTNGRNHSRVDDADIKKSVTAIEQELDATKRYAMTKAIQPSLAEKMWYVPAVAWQIRWDVAAPKLHGIYDFQTYRGGNFTVEKANLWFDA